MPVSAPSGNSSSLQRDATLFRVLLGPDDGSRPTAADEIDWLEPLSVQLSAGGSRLDALKLRVNFPKMVAAGLLDQPLLQDQDLAFVGNNRLVEIRATDSTGAFTRVLGWGKFAGDSLSIDKEQQADVVVARLDPYLFGGPLEGFPVKNPAGGTITVDDKLAFNPLIDGTIRGNRSSATVTTTSGLYNLFVDPESMYSANAQRQHPGETIDKWDMASAVTFLCQWLNGDETYVTNPDPDDLQTLFDGFDSSQLRNMPIPLGKYLPDALDELLKPFGYWWFLDNSTDDGDPDAAAKSTITLFKRGKGSETQLYLGRSGQPISLKGTNLGGFKVERSLAHMSNVIDGCSSLGLFQVTLPLFPAWKPEQNSTNPQTLGKDTLTASTHDIGRKFACNLAGDYTPSGGGNFGASGIAIFTPDLSTAFGVSAVAMKRRVLHHCLSLDGPVGEGHSLGIWVEWWNPSTPQPAGGTVGSWQKLDEPHSILKREDGIWFEGDFPPLGIWNYVTKGPAAAGAVGFSQPHWPFGLRVTASIVADIRTWSRGTRSPQSPNGADVKLVLDLSQKYPWRALALTGDYASQLPGTAAIANVVVGSGGSASISASGNLVANFPAGTKFQVTGSTGNDGPYTVVLSSYNAGLGQTTLRVAESVPSAVFDGFVVWNTDILDPLHPTSGVPIGTYCQTLQDWQDAATLSTSVLLDSADHAEYQIGQVVTQLAGRRLLLNAKQPSGPSDNPRHPQIVGINYLLDGQQRMELVLESFRREEFPELEDKGEGRHSHAQTTVKPQHAAKKHAHP